MQIESIPTISLSSVDYDANTILDTTTPMIVFPEFPAAIALPASAWDKFEAALHK